MPANYCWNCGDRLNEGMVFCPQCGTAIRSENVAQRIQEPDAGRTGTQGSPAPMPEILESPRKWTQLESLENALAPQNTGAFKDSREPDDLSPAYALSGAAQQFHMRMAASYVHPAKASSTSAGAMDSASGQNASRKRDQPLQDQAQIAGTWFYQLQTPYGIANYQLFMDSTKNFSCQTTMNGIMAYDMGDYQHQGDFLHFVVKNHEPKKRNGRKESWLTSWGYYYKAVDADKLIFEDRLVGGHFYVYRIKGQ